MDAAPSLSDALNFFFGSAMDQAREYCQINMIENIDDFIFEFSIVNEAGQLEVLGHEDIVLHLKNMFSGDVKNNEKVLRRFAFKIHQFIKVRLFTFKKY